MKNSLFRYGNSDIYNIGISITPQLVYFEVFRGTVEFIVRKPLNGRKISWLESKKSTGTFIPVDSCGLKV